MAQYLEVMGNLRFPLDCTYHGCPHFLSPFFQVITNDSVDRLGLTAGRLLTAEVKAPWVVLTRSDGQPASSAENRFHGTITSIRRGRVSSEIAVRIDESTELCAIVSTAGWRQLGLSEHDPVRVVFNCFAVILHAD